MMLTLSLLRHAKSSWDDPELADHERPLAKRGARGAPRIGRLLLERQILPDLVLCSGAVRARATLTLVLAAFEATRRARLPEIHYDDALYLAEPAALLGRLEVLAGAARHVLMVGHNPGLHALALSLTGAGQRRDLAQLALGFPTAALAVIDIDAAGWQHIKPGRGTLRLLATPKNLD